MQNFDPRMFMQPQFQPQPQMTQNQPQINPYGPSPQGMASPRTRGMGGSIRPGPGRQSFGPPNPATVSPGNVQRMVPSMAEIQNMPDQGGVRAGNVPKMNAVQQARQQPPVPSGNPGMMDPRNAAILAYGQR